MASSSSICCRFSHGVPSISSPPSNIRRSGGGLVPSRSFSKVLSLVVRASTSIDSYESSYDFVKRVEQAWLISEQPRPVACSSCESNGHVELKWCGRTGFFIIGSNMLCEVPSRNTSCIICAGKGSTCCRDCKGTGFRAKWLGNACCTPGIPHKHAQNMPQKC